MRKVFCPAEIKEIKEIFIPLCEALSAISAISAGLLVSHAESFLSRRNEGNQGNLHPPWRSSFCYFCYFCGTISISCGKFFVPQKSRKSRKSSSPSAKPFLLFLLFLRDLKHAGWLDLFYYPKEMKETKEIQVSDVALGRPSASKLLGQELQKVK